MKILVGLFLCLCINSCYFGANESGVEIINDCYLARWDENTWISYTKDGTGIWNHENMIIQHNVFAVGNDDNFIIAKQHPCKNELPHIQDHYNDSIKPDRTITRYFIIDTRDNTYNIHSYSNVPEFDRAKLEFGIDKNLPFKFYAKEID